MSKPEPLVAYLPEDGSWIQTRYVQRVGKPLQRRTIFRRLVCAVLRGECESRWEDGNCYWRRNQGGE